MSYLVSSLWFGSPLASYQSSSSPLQSSALLHQHCESWSKGRRAPSCFRRRVIASLVLIALGDGNQLALGSTKSKPFIPWWCYPAVKIISISMIIILIINIIILLKELLTRLVWRSCSLGPAFVEFSSRAGSIGQLISFASSKFHLLDKGISGCATIPILQFV